MKTGGEALGPGAWRGGRRWSPGPGVSSSSGREDGEQQEGEAVEVKRGRRVPLKPKIEDPKSKDVADSVWLSRT